MASDVIKNLLHLLRAATNDSEWSTATQAKDHLLPEKLYRYRVFPGQYVIPSLRESKVWLSRPEEFNDPFDSVHAIGMLGPAMSMTDSFAEQIADAISKADPNIAVQIAELRQQGVTCLKILQTMGRSSEVQFLVSTMGTYLGGMEYALDDIQMLYRRKLGVCCFTASSSSILMWSHYADNHRGICVEYDISKWPPGDPLREDLYPVIYEEQLVEARGVLSNQHPGLLAALHKAPDWQYEKEWRLVRHLPVDDADRNVATPKPTVIYVGACFPEAHRHTLNALAAELRVPLRQMRRQPDAFALDDVELDASWYAALSNSRTMSVIDEINRETERHRQFIEAAKEKGTTTQAWDEEANRHKELTAPLFEELQKLQPA